MTNSKSTEFDAQELLALARIDMERGTLDQALQKIKQLLANADVPDEGYALAGRLYAQLGLWNRAKELFQRYLQKNPQAVNETFQLGMVHFDAGQLGEAVDVWDGLLQKQTMHPPALFYRALAQSQRGKVAEARADLDTLLKSAPTDNLYFGRGKELLQVLDVQQPLANGAALGKRDVPFGISKDAYKTEH